MDSLGINYSTISISAPCVSFIKDANKANVGLCTNADGMYLGDPTLDPVLSALSAPNSSVFVHSASPKCTSVALGHPIPMTGYLFDIVRAMGNLFLMVSVLNTQP
ncbi:Amidohydrolase 2 [Penicillium argentinense]|uniref:Amidohydrolase 2 n=1 Tax=Penicillium argentinense TaxID=1131581 RepID=A0A9W9FD88_9EURO|nr:Amidohydrolase 2 [Penicillium argentinense]KAJ5097822.1 Amidohydrolase 2 [Penicillium argentinense]